MRLREHEEEISMTKLSSLGIRDPNLALQDTSVRLPKSAEVVMMQIDIQ